MGFTLPSFATVSIQELKNIIHTAGKRALSRIRTLDKAFGKAGSLYGRKSYILDMYGDFNTQVKGKSKSALYLQAQKAYGILNAKSSTVKGIKEMDNQRMKTFQKHHPNIADVKDESKYKKAMQILGKLQAAERGTKYDSDEQVSLAYDLADQPDAAIDWVIDQINNGEYSSSDYFEGLSIQEQAGFLSVDEAGVQSLPFDLDDSISDTENTTDTEFLNPDATRKASRKKSENKQDRRKK